MNERIDYLHDKALSLTKSPGVYLMKNKQGKIIYVGKAKILTNRVRSYFRKNAVHQEKVQRMVDNVYDFDYIVTDSEFEALVLECSLIKQYSPKYNILLKDDKGYSYIRITNDKYPRITAEKKKNDVDMHLGPYMSGFTVKQTVDEVNRVFMLPTCRRKFPEEFRKGRPCLNYHIKRCQGVCLGNISEKEYKSCVDEAVKYIKSGSAQSVKEMTESMQRAAEQLDFERAAKIRDRIRAVERAAEHQKIIKDGEKDRDVVAVAQNGDNCCAVVLKYRQGRLTDKQTFMFGLSDDLSETRNEFMLRFYSSNEDLPRQINIDGEIADSELIMRLLREKTGHIINISVPQKGEAKRLIIMAQTNAAEQLSHLSARTGKELAALDELSRLLGLKKTPAYIEAYDISNLGDTGIVAGMVVFENARPLKKAYKKFALKDMAARDDYASMQQVITRRLERYLTEKDSKEGFGRLPDLILLDGGKGHVSAVEPIIKKYGLDIPVFGMVKDDKHHTRAIAKTGGEISVSSNRSAFTLITAIQDEVHRFAVTFQRKTRSKTAFSSKLTSVKGIGEKKAAALMKKYKTKAELKKLSVQDIMKTAGVGLNTAEELYNVIQNF